MNAFLPENLHLREKQMRVWEDLFEPFKHVNIRESNSLRVRSDTYTECSIPVTILKELADIYPYTVKVEGPAVKLRSRRIPQRLFLKAKEEVNRLVTAKELKRNQSQWAAPNSVLEKADQSVRIISDFRSLNKRTVPDVYNLPNVQNNLFSLKGARLFTKIDLSKVFYTIRIAERDKSTLPLPHHLEISLTKPSRWVYKFSLSFSALYERFICRHE